MNGLFISFEGIDGAGKSTHINTLADLFRAQGRAVVLTREPGGTPLAEHLRHMVLNDPMDTLTEVLLVFAARRDHVTRVIVPALARGDVVLCDRFTDASFAYQGAGRGFDLGMLSMLENWVQSAHGLAMDARGKALLQPDLTFWFDLPASVAADRLASARAPDKFESQPQVFFDKVANGYSQRMQGDPGRFARIAANQPPELVWLEVKQAVTSRGLVA